MSDLVERLRKRRRAAGQGDPINEPDPVCAEAADEIERLTAALQKLRGELEGLTKEARQVDEWLKTQKEQLRNALTERPRDDGTAVAVGGEPGASAGKSE